MAGYDPYGTIARYYALEQEEQSEDIPFFLDLARRAGGAVLDVGCGDGRLAEALAGQRFDVTAVDSSPAMLALARERLGAQVGGRVRLEQADMRTLRLPGSHHLAVCAAGTFAHVTDEDDQLRALRAIRRQLAVDGIVALVLQNPYQFVVDPPNGEVVVQWRGIESATGNAVVKLVTNHADLALQHLQVSVAYDVVQRDGLLRRFSSDFTLRWSYRPELDLLLQRAGFSPLAWYGDYDGSPYSSESPLLIAVARRS